MKGIQRFLREQAYLLRRKQKIKKYRTRKLISDDQTKRRAGVILVLLGLLLIFSRCHHQTTESALGIIQTIMLYETL